MSSAVLSPPRRPPARHPSPPRPPGGSGGGGGSDWVRLVAAANDIEAHLLIGRLTEAGVETAAVKDRAQPGAWLHGGSDPWAPVVVLVRRLQLDDARLVMAELSYEAPPAQPASVGAVGGGWKGPLLWWALAISLGLMFTALSLTATARWLTECARTDCLQEGVR